MPVIMILMFVLLISIAAVYSFRFDSKEIDLLAQRNMISRKTLNRISRQRIFAVPDDLSVESVDLSTYSPPEVGWEIWTGSIIAIIPIIWASIEFNNRIVTQRQCLVCQGSGLVYKTKAGNSLTKPRKCYNCGGFLPWLGWKRFFLTSFFDVGNGGVLQRPANDYSEVNAAIRNQQQQQQMDDGNSDDE